MRNCWQGDSELLREAVPALYRGWLFKTDILTQHLREALGPTNVVVLNQSYQPVLIDEVTTLGVVENESVWVREIYHQAQAESLIYARVTLPKATHEKLEKLFGSLKDQPLGETFLYNNPAVKREAFEYACIEKGHPLYEAAKFADKKLWARRSVFRWQGLPILVTEVFSSKLPAHKVVPRDTQKSQIRRQKYRDYLQLIRLHRPIPILLMLWPTLWGLWLAAKGVPNWKVLLIFIIGVVVMRSAGDIFNDMADRKLDSQVERTHRRPMATGRVSVAGALVFAGILLVIALALVLMLNELALLWAMVGLALAVVYPFIKRFSHWPQAVLGLAYNWGIILAFAAIQNQVPLFAWFVLIVSTLWTIAYDSMYALADYNDDIELGVKSTAVFFGKHYHAWIGLFQLLTLIGLVCMGIWQDFNLSYYVACVLTIPFFVYQHRLLPGKQLTRCIHAFNNNHWPLLIILIGIVIQFL